MSWDWALRHTFGDLKKGGSDSSLVQHHRSYVACWGLTEVAWRCCRMEGNTEGNKSRVQLFFLLYFNKNKNKSFTIVPFSVWLSESLAKYWIQRPVSIQQLFWEWLAVYAKSPPDTCTPLFFSFQCVWRCDDWNSFNSCWWGTQLLLSPVVSLP